MFEFYTFDRKREFINLLIQNGKSEMIGAEIGVWKGDTSAYLLDNNPGLHMVGVDSYPTAPNADAELAAWGVTHWLWFKNDADAQAMYELTKSRFDGYGDRAKLVRSPSVEAAKLFSDELFDFVYIDGNHLYEQVKADIEAWTPKVRKGGWLIGDDFSWCLRTDQVAKAVVECFAYNFGVLADTWFMKRA